MQRINAFFLNGSKRNQLLEGIAKASLQQGKSQKAALDARSTAFHKTYIWFFKSYTAFVEALEVIPHRRNAW